jgi:hypothetical protein
MRHPIHLSRPLRASSLPRLLVPSRPDLPLRVQVGLTFAITLELPVVAFPVLQAMLKLPFQLDQVS